jgi:hypothetical protein
MYQHKYRNIVLFACEHYYSDTDGQGDMMGTYEEIKEDAPT